MILGRIYRFILLICYNIPSTMIRSIYMIHFACRDSLYNVIRSNIMIPYRDMKPYLNVWVIMILMLQIALYDSILF
nr:MAG TPA: hypothetical protein [Caudoviricetes sp.]